MAALLGKLPNFIPNISKICLFGKSNNFKLIHTAIYPLQFQFTPILNAEPLKRKKRIDPAIMKMREDRKKRRIEKSIRQLEKAAKTLKPIEELEISPKLKKDLHLRQRNVKPLTYEEIEYRDNLQRKWSNYKLEQHKAEMEMIERILLCQEKALKALREESEELFQSAIQVDESLIPFKVSGPTFTPPITKYEVPDGDYLDITKKWR